MSPGIALAVVELTVTLVGLPILRRNPLVCLDSQWIGLLAVCAVVCWTLYH